MIIGINNGSKHPLDIYNIVEITSEDNNTILVKFKDDTYESFNKLKRDLLECLLFMII